MCVRARACLFEFLYVFAALQGSFSSLGCETGVLEEFGGKGKGKKGKKKSVCSWVVVQSKGRDGVPWME